MFKQFYIVKTLLKKEFTLEFRGKNSFFASILFVITTSFISFQLIQNQLNIHYWSALFWITNLFNAFQITQSNFSNENQGSLLYQFTLIHPMHFAAYKIIYFSILLFFLGCISLLIWVFLGIPLSQIPSWLYVLFTHSVIISSTLTLISFMSAKVSGNFSLISILSLPILMPHLLLLSKLTKSLLLDSPFVVYQKYFFGCGLLMLISLALSFILFPYLWRE